jgi:hypothetical protein
MTDPMPPTATVDLRPITFDLEGAKAYTGLSKWRLETLLKEEKIGGRKEGDKTLYDRESLDRYIRSLPPYTRNEVRNGATR